MNSLLYDSLVQIAGADNVLIDEPMKKHTTFRIGGMADYFVTPTDVLSLTGIISECLKNNIEYYIIGNGSNLLVGDGGYRGVIVQLYDRFNNITWQGQEVTVMAGALLSKVGRQAADKGCSGFEFATGIPGTVGGAVAMNAGAYGGEISDCIVKARLMDSKGNMKWYSKEELRLGYRKSVVIDEGLVVIEAVLRLQKSTREKVEKKLVQLMTARKEKQPLEFPSAGSTFKRPEGYFAGQLIQEAGLKGFAYGNAMVSDKHSGFVINKGNATAKEVITLISMVQEKVYENSGIRLEPEVKILGEFQ